LLLVTKANSSRARLGFLTSRRLGIETHSHLTFPVGGAAWGGPATCEDAYTAHASAASGGTTTVFDFIQSPQPEALEAGLDYYMAESLKGALDFQVCSLLFCMVIC